MPPLGEGASVGEGAALLAYHWLRAEEWEKALTYTLEAAERAQKLFARPEADQPLLASPRADGAPAHILPNGMRPLRGHSVARSASGSMRDEEAEARLLRHVDQALTNATDGWPNGDYGKAGINKGQVSG